MLILPGNLLDLSVEIRVKRGLQGQALGPMLISSAALPFSVSRAKSAAGGHAGGDTMILKILLAPLNFYPMKLPAASSGVSSSPLAPSFRA